MNLKKDVKIFIFPGPGKTGTSWLHDSLRRSKHFEIIFGKDFPFALIDENKIVSKINKSKKNYFAIFNHEIIKYKKMKNFLFLDPTFIVFEREFRSRILSSINQHIKEGLVSINQIDNKFINEVATEELDNKEIRKRLHPFKRRTYYFDFKNFFSGDEKVKLKLSRLLNININDLNTLKRVNENQKSRFPKLLNFFRINIGHNINKFYPNLYTSIKLNKYLRLIFFSQQRNIDGQENLKNKVYSLIRAD